MTSLATHSSIDHELFPLFSVRSCISEADESLNGPRFCVQDTFTGAAYEVRSCRLVLEADTPTGKNTDNKSLSPSNLNIVRRQQDRIDTLLSISSKVPVPPSVSLPIDIYIQEQPSTGDTYVASVDPFAGLSLGDIIRSGWGIIEELVFMEILHAVETFGYASASLPPHGNLSCDAVKQLLTVRDGASEARQPSRWVVGDWLLLYDERVDSYDPNAFIADVEWMLYSSFSQLSVSTQPDGIILSRQRVEELINGCVERVRYRLLGEGNAEERRSAGVHAGGAANARLDSTLSGVGRSGGGGADHVSPSKFHAGGGVSPLSANGTSSTQEDPEPHSDSQVSTSADHAGDVLDSIRQMTIKDKMAYHQAALRSEQLLVNRHRRKNAPLPPRPQPASPPMLPQPAPTHSDMSSEDLDEGPSLSSPIEVKPSAYLTQNRRGLAGNSTNGTRPQKSPRARLSDTTRSATGRSSGKDRTPSSAREQRERLLEDVVNLAVMKQHRRSTELRNQQQICRTRREELRQALAKTAQLNEARKRPIPALLNNSRLREGVGAAKVAGAPLSPRRKPLANRNPQHRNGAAAKAPACTAPQSHYYVPAATPSTSLTSISPPLPDRDASESPEPKPPFPPLRKGGGTAAPLVIPDADVVKRLNTAPLKRQTAAAPPVIAVAEVGPSASAMPNAKKLAGEAGNENRPWTTGCSTVRSRNLLNMQREEQRAAVGPCNRRTYTSENNIRSARALQRPRQPLDVSAFPRSARAAPQTVKERRRFTMTEGAPLSAPLQETISLIKPLPLAEVLEAAAQSGPSGVSSGSPRPTPPGTAPQRTAPSPRQKVERVPPPSAKRWVASPRKNENRSAAAAPVPSSAAKAVSGELQPPPTIQASSSPSKQTHSSVGGGPQRRTARQVNEERVFPASSRPAMRRLVPDKVTPGPTVEATPPGPKGGTSAEPSAPSVTPLTKSKLSKMKEAANALTLTPNSNSATTRDAPLRSARRMITPRFTENIVVRSVHPVNETSPGILLRRQHRH